MATKGLSFKHVEVSGGTKFILLDSEGSFSPVKVSNELSVVEKEATELFLQELIFEMSDYFLCDGLRLIASDCVGLRLIATDCV